VPRRTFERERWEQAELGRRGFLHLAMGAAAFSTLVRTAAAQAYPSRPVRWIVGFAPGGGNDIVARLMGQRLSERLGQAFVIENRPGAAGNLAADAVVHARPDGHTLLLVSSNNATNAAVYDNLGFDFVRDIAPVAGIGRTPLVMAVNPSVPAKTVPDFVAYAKANPGKINMGSAGTGGIGHLAGEQFKMMTGIDMTHVPYRGNGPALTGLLGGEVQVLFPVICVVARIRFDRQAQRTGGRGRATRGKAPGATDRRRVRSRLRGQHMVRRRRAQRHAGGNHRPTLRGDRRDPRRAATDGKVRGARRRRGADGAGRIRPLCRR
jgi:hypothetical protein